MTVVTRELLADAATSPGITELVMSRLARAQVIAQEDKLFNGTGTNQPVGIGTELKNTSAFNTVKTADTVKTITEANLLDVVNKTPSYALSNAVWVCRRDMLTTLQQVKGDAGRYAFTPNWNPQATQIPGTRFSVLGYPVLVSDYIPVDKNITGLAGSNAGTILFGDLSGIYLGARESIRVETTTEGTHFTNDTAATKSIQRWGLQIAEPKKITALFYKNS